MKVRWWFNLLERTLLNFRYCLRMEVKGKQCGLILGRTVGHLEIHRKKLGSYEIVPCPRKWSSSDGMVFTEKKGELEDFKASSIYRLCESKGTVSVETENESGRKRPLLWIRWSGGMRQAVSKQER